MAMESRARPREAPDREDREARDGVWAEIEHLFICLHFGPSRSYLQFFYIVASCERG